MDTPTFCIRNRQDFVNLEVCLTDCARDTMIHFPERGMAVTETCQANGNYRPNQNVGNVFYCVDRDGYPTTDFLDEWPADNCQSFA